MIIEHPAAGLLLLPIIGAFIFYIIRLCKVFSCLSSNLGNPSKKRLIAGGLLRAASCALMVLSFARIKSNKASAARTAAATRGEAGDAIALVFDISYSMTAMDTGGKPYQVSRLDAAVQFAKMVIKTLPAAPISVALAKGDGLVAVPLTMDKDAVNALLDAISPALMSAAGTRLGAGIEAAISTFPSNVDYRRHIWLFTDGGETDNALSESVEKAVKSGCSVSLIGFGSESGCEVTAGDGKTKVHTALMSGALKDAANKASVTLEMKTQSQYIAASSSGAASLLLSNLNSNTAAINADDTATNAAGESAFILCAILLFILSIAVTQTSRKKRAASLVVLTAVLTGCSAGSAAQTLKGAWAWRQGKAQKAVASFMHVLHSSKQSRDEESGQYALYNIAAVYISMAEYDAALSCMEKIAEDAPVAVKYASSYNQGVLYFSKGEYKKAVECFRLALIADSTSLQAKENLEIARAALKESAVKEQSFPPAAGKDSDEDRAAQAVFDKVREQDKQQWKSKEQSTLQPSSADY